MSDATMCTIYLAGGCFWGVEELFRHIVPVCLIREVSAQRKGPRIMVMHADACLMVAHLHGHDAVAITRLEDGLRLEHRNRLHQYDS